MLGLRAQDSVTVCNGGDECCDGITCGLGEGDCDSHEDCVGHLRCGDDNCDGPGFDSTDDCCEEDPAFPPPSPEKDFKMCETRWRFEQNIVQAAAALGCGFAKDEERKISLNECSQTSCSSKLIGESFTCNNQNKEETCTELENLHLDVQYRINTECLEILRGGKKGKKEKTCYWCWSDWSLGNKRSNAIKYLQKGRTFCTYKNGHTDNCHTCCEKMNFKDTIKFTATQCNNICAQTCNYWDNEAGDCKQKDG